MTDPRYLSDRHISPAEAAATLKCSRRTLERRTAAGHIGHVKDGRRVLYLREEIERYLDSRYTPPVVVGFGKNRSRA